MNLGDRVKARRQELGLTQRELAARLGYNNHTTLTRLEAGKIDPPQSRIAAIAEALGVTPGYLMGWEDEPEDVGALAAEVLKDPRLLSLVKNYIQLDNEGKGTLSAVAAGLVGKEKRPTPKRQPKKSGK